MKNKKIFLAGHKGLVGSSILRSLINSGYQKIFTIDKFELNLLDQSAVYDYLNRIKPDAVIVAAAKVGGIYANLSRKADFIYQNLTIQNNLIHGSYKSGVKNLLFLGTSCCYPKFAQQPISEDQLLNGPLEHTNEPYAIAKIAGIKMCESYANQYKLNYKSLMPCNLFGPGDNYDLENSHFLPALIRKIYNAKINNENFITLWGSGKPLREIMYVDDLSEAVKFFLFKKIDFSYLNVGSSIEYSINDYAKIVSEVLNHKSLKFIFDASKPDGTPRKILNSERANKLGWKASIKIEYGIKLAYDDYLSNKIE